MASVKFRANLTSPDFPFLTNLFGESVIVGGLDQEQEIPLMYYAHNVMPTKKGIASVGFNQLIAAPAGSDSLFDETFTIRDASENVAQFAHMSNGKNYVWVNAGIGWIQTTTTAAAVNGVVSVAHVNGQSYIYLGNVGCYVYNFTTNVLTLTALTSLTAAAIIGISSSSGYLLAYDATSLYWSSLLDPTDFTPSLTTGAGSEAIQTAKAAITCVLPVGGGIIIYTKRNAISAAYSGNSQFPWLYREIEGAGGISKQSLVAYAGNSTNNIAYTTSGFQEIALNNSNAVFPDLTDFIAGSIFEDFNEISLEFTRLELSSPMLKKCVIIGNRYLVVSYGVSALTHAIVFDFGLKRWGKLKLTHVDCFEYFVPSSDVIETPKRAIGFMQADGTIYNTILSYNLSNSYGTMIAGKYQLDRNHYIGTQEIHLQSVREDSTLRVNVINEIEGDVSFETPTLVTSTAEYRRYNCRVIGINQSVVITGGFQLHYLGIKATEEGEAR